MRNGWPRKELGELAELKGRIGWRGLTAKEYTKTGPLFLSVHSLNYGDYVDFRDAFHISEERYAESPEIMLQKDDVLICKDGAGIGKLGILGTLPDRATINSSLLLIRSGKEILPKFLYRCLSSPYFQQIVHSRLNGATTPHLYQRDITEFPVVLPPLAEQERIVGLLDEAFEGIATAKAHAEKNLQNARALFESHLESVFTKGGPRWAAKKLGDICRIKTGKKDVNEGNAEGKYPFFTCAAAHTYSDSYSFEGEALLVAGNGNVGQVSYYSGKFEAYQRTYVLCDFEGVRADYLFRVLDKRLSAAVSKQKLGNTMPYIKVGMLTEFILPVPPEKEQERLAAAIDKFAKETERLASLYARKLAALEALKKSLLHQAFTGQL